MQPDKEIKDKPIQEESVWVALPKDDDASMSMTLFIYWFLPILLLAVISRFTVDTSVGEIDVKPHTSIPIMLDERYLDAVQAAKKVTPPTDFKSNTSKSPTPQPFVPPSNWPTAYLKNIQNIEYRRKRWKDHPRNTMPQSTHSDAPQKVDTNAAGRPLKRPSEINDPQRTQLVVTIDRLRDEYRRDPSDMYRAIQFADVMRYYDVNYHDGGTYEHEAIEVYQKIVQMAESKKQEKIEALEPTNVTSNGNIQSVSDELVLDYTAKSIDGILCAVYTSLGKVYYMANMFERAVESHTKCLDIEPNYIDALNSRASTYIILGKYENAGQDFINVITYDKKRLFPDAFTGLARVLEAKEDVVPGGWERMVNILDQLIPLFEQQIEMQPQAKNVLANALNRYHHAMFSYHDQKTKDFDEAFRHLSQGHQYKMSTLAPWNRGAERQKVFQTSQIFGADFWPSGVGSPTTTPIFIIGFVRSGSTLLERILDAHPMIVGTGENSVFNGRLGEIRDKIVEVGMVQNKEKLSEVTYELAETVVDGMRKRWEILDANTPKDGEEENEYPQRFVDKMLTNYYNVGFIHLLYPNAVILHVYRNPMDTLFSAYKHEFPPGTLDYTCNFESLAELYHSYRDIIEHWDAVLPGRVTHIRYEDMVHDTPGMARAIIDATGLPWDETVLDFHKKKHAVNTLSSTQVRKGIYKDSLNSWMRYERHLQPLVELIGDRINFDLEIPLGYKQHAKINDEL